MFASFYMLNFKTSCNWPFVSATSFIWQFEHAKFRNAIFGVSSQQTLIIRATNFLT